MTPQPAQGRYKKVGLARLYLELVFYRRNPYFKKKEEELEEWQTV